MAATQSEDGVVGGDVIMRRARFDDYDQIVEMSKDVFDGSDYLATTFYEILHNPDMISYVADYRGQVVRSFLRYDVYLYLQKKNNLTQNSNTYMLEYV